MPEGSSGAGVEGGGTGAAVSPATPPSAEVVQRLEGQVIPQARAEAEQRDTALKEAAKPEDKVPTKVRENDEFKRIYGDYYHAAMTNSPDGEVDIAGIDKLASDRYYSDLAEKTQAQGIPQEVNDDPLFQKEYGRVVMDAQKEGKPLDRAELERLAFKEYQRQKDLRAESAQSETGKAETADQDLSDPNKVRAAIDKMPLTDEVKELVWQKYLEAQKAKNKPPTALELILLIVGTIIQETAGMVIPRSH